MKLRIAIWAGVGALAAVFWALWISATSANLHGIAWIMACVTCPVSLLGRYPLSFYVVLVVNASTYAVVGTVVETIRRRYRPLKHA